MKLLTIILIVMGSLPLFAQNAPVIKAKFTKLADMKKATTKVAKVKNMTQKKGSEDVLKKIFEQNQKIAELLKRRSSIPVIWEQRSKILTGKVVRGTLLNSINSTNTSSPILVKAHVGQGLEPNTKFTCSGVTSNERVFVLCNKMVNAEKEIAISAQVLNIDGTSGLVGQFDDGKDDLIAGAVISNFASGVLSFAQNRITSPLGSVRDDSAKNQILQGLIESGKTTSDVLTEEMKSKEPIVTVNAGLEVLVYFMEAVDEH